MKWAFLPGSPDISGGAYVIYEHAIRAAQQGIDVTMVTECAIDMARLHWHPEARRLRWATFDEIVDKRFDIAIATWWRTAYELYRVPARTYAYFVQSIESRFYRRADEEALRKLVEATYILPLHVVTEARWIQRHLFEKYGIEARLVRNGIRKDIYKSSGDQVAQRSSGKLRVLVEGPLNVPFKNVEKAIELCRRSLADEVWLLTSTRVDRVPGVDRVFSEVPIFETAAIYRSCDVLVKLSYVEGMFGPPLEMFHCGGTSIVFDVTGHDEYMSHGGNSLIVPRGDEERVVKYINELRTHANLLAQLKEGALATASTWPDWSVSSREFAESIREFTRSRSIPVRDLGKTSGFFFEYYETAEKLRLSNPSLTGRQQDRIKRLKVSMMERYPAFYRALSSVRWRIKSWKGSMT